MRRILERVALGPLLFVTAAYPQSSEDGLNPVVRRIVDGISQTRIEANLRALESFQTRHILSAREDPSHGIGAAEQWIYNQFKSDSPRLQVSAQPFRVKKGARRGQVLHDVELTNVVAVLPGTRDAAGEVLVTAHYDTVHLAHKPKATDEQRLASLTKRGMDEPEARRYMELFPAMAAYGEVDPQATAAQEYAPGVTDDGSGTAAVLELARVMSRYQFHKTVVFIAFSAEEIGLEGSKAYAAAARKNGTQIEAVLNNDIIGSDVSGNGLSSNSTLRVFADGPEDSPSRALLRYTKRIAERYVPSMNVRMVFRRDRFMRGGDHTSFARQGYAAVRLTTPNENYQNQHSATDTLANTSVPYTTRVTRMNAAVLASLALAPSPVVLNYTIQSGDRKGDRSPLLSRGKSGYDAALRWLPSDAPDLAGYAVVIRDTTAPDWEREVWVGNRTSYTIPDLSIDDVVIGIKAVDRDGDESIVSAYLEPTRQELVAAPAAPSAATR